jgi:hypothetical protein
MCRKKGGVVLYPQVDFHRLCAVVKVPLKDLKPTAHVSTAHCKGTDCTVNTEILAACEFQHQRRVSGGARCLLQYRAMLIQWNEITGIADLLFIQTCTLENLGGGYAQLFHVVAQTDQKTCSN